MKVSDYGVELIKNFEGYESKPYECTAGKLTIGYGHVIKKNEFFLHVDKFEAERLLFSDLVAIEAFLSNEKLNQNQFDALASLIFNVGLGAFSRSKMLQKIRVKDYKGAATEFDDWHYIRNSLGVLIESGSLKARRVIEKELFLS